MGKYDWKRFWYPEGQTPRLHEGFLYVWEQFETISRPISDFSVVTCLVLLGEPGMGKSTELLSSFENTPEDEANLRIYQNLNAIPDTYWLDREVFTSPVFKEWLAGNQTLHLFLDSLDEALINIDTLSALLANEIAKLPHQRLILRLSCRSADWGSFRRLDDQLASIWKGEHKAAIHLAPLRLDDAILAARSEGVDDRAFLEGIQTKNLGPLAAKPVTLRLLLGIFQKDGSFPDTQYDIYREGCLVLAQEDDQDRPATSRADQLTAFQRLEVSATVGLSLVFCGKASIVTDLSVVNPTPADIRAEDLQTFGLTEEAIFESLGKGLFKSEGPGRISIGHQTFAEFLASWSLEQREVSDDTIISLLGKTYVHPQLHEVAAWIAVRRPNVLAHLLKVAPETLLRGDVLTMSDERKAHLTEKLLEDFEAKRSYSVNDFAGFRKLDHRGLADQLAPYLEGYISGSDASIAAINISRACKVTQLTPRLLRIALDKRSDQYTRMQALFTLDELADIDQLAELKPILEENVSDPKGELRTQVLEMLWPKILDSSEFFALLANLDHGPSYFTIKNIEAALDSIQLPAGLRWALHTLKKHGGFPYQEQKLLELLLSKALLTIENDEVLEALIDLIEEMSRRYYHISFSTEAKETLTPLLSEPHRRRRILTALLTRFESEDNRWNLSNGALISFQAMDATWMIDEYCENPDTPQGRHLLEILAGWIGMSQSFYSPGMSADLFDTIGAGVDSCPEFATAIGPLLAPIEFAYGEKNPDQERYEKFLLNKKDFADVEEKPEPVSPSPRELVLQALQEFEDGDLDVWWRKITHFMRFDPNGRAISELNTNMTEFPVWAVLDDSAQLKIAQSAQAFLSGGDPRTSEWIDEGDLYYPALGGYLGFILLEKFVPGELDALGDETWRKWVPSMAFVSPYDGENSRKDNQTILKEAYLRVPDAVQEILAKQIEIESLKDHPNLDLYRYDLSWDDNLRQVLREAARSTTLKTSIIKYSANYLRWVTPKRKASRVTRSCYRCPTTRGSGIVCELRYVICFLTVKQDAGIRFGRNFKGTASLVKSSLNQCLKSPITMA